MFLCKLPTANINDLKMHVQHIIIIINYFNNNIIAFILEH